MLPFKKRSLHSSTTSERAEPVRCAFVVTSMLVGGAETLLVNLLRRMDHNSFHPHIICLKEKGELGEEVASEFPIYSDLIRNKYDVTVLPRLVTLMRQQQIDAVITVAAGDNMFWGRMAAWIAGVPFIASALHSTGWPDGVGRLNRLLTPVTDAFIGVAESHGEFLREFERFPASKVNIIRNGVDCDRFRPDETARHQIRQELQLSADTPLIGIVAALRPEKNHLMLVQAAARLRRLHPGAHWVIVGEGSERTAIVDLANQLQVADRLHLLGTRHDTDRILAALDVFTLCSLNEASPVSILEALASEVPVVSTDVGSIKETVIDGVTGLLFESEDTAAMVHSIDRLLHHSQERKSMGRAGRTLVLQTGSLQSMVSGYQNLMSRHLGLSATSAQAEVSSNDAPATSSALPQLTLPPTPAGQTVIP